MQKVAASAVSTVLIGYCFQFMFYNGRAFWPEWRILQFLANPTTGRAARQVARVQVSEVRHGDDAHRVLRGHDAVLGSRISEVT